MENSGYGLCLAGVDLSSVSVADDMVLISLTSFGLQKMLEICYEYSCKWRFLYNPSKCAVIEFNEVERASGDRIWHLGTNVISEVDNYTHLGVLCNKQMKTSLNVEESCKKLKSTLFGLVNVGLHENGLLPTTSLKIYKSIVMPKALYGCELWFGLNNTQITMFEKAHRLCLKYIHNFPSYTRTDICLGIAGLYQWKLK